MLSMNLLVAQGVVVLIIVGVVVVGAGLYWLLSDSYQMVVTATGTTIPLNTRVTVTASLQRRSWRFGSWTNVPGNFSVRVGATGILAPNPMTAATSAATPTFSVTVAGTATGTDTVRITGTTLDGSANASGAVGMTVVGG